jgi:DNA anti-recombination protein RmuC
MTNEELEKRLNYFESLVNEKLDKIEDILDQIKDQIKDADDTVLTQYDMDVAFGDFECTMESSIDSLREELIDKIQEEVEKIQESIDTIADRS